MAEEKEQVWTKYFNSISKIICLFFYRNVSGKNKARRKKKKREEREYYNLIAEIIVI